MLVVFPRSKFSTDRAAVVFSPTECPKVKKDPGLPARSLIESDHISPLVFDKSGFYICIVLSDFFNRGFFELVTTLHPDFLTNHQCPRVHWVLLEDGLQMPRSTLECAVTVAFNTIEAEAPDLIGKSNIYPR